MSRTIETILRLQGESEYRTGLKNCASEMKVMKSELSLVSSEFRTNANSMEALTAKGDVLTRMYDNQEKKVALLRGALENAQKTQAEEQQAVADLREQYDRAKKSLDDFGDSVDEANEDYKKAKAETDNLREALVKHQAKLDASTGAVSKYTIQLNRAEVELNGLSDRQEENNRLLQEAKSSADGCAKSIDRYGDAAQEAAGCTQKTCSAVEVLAEQISASNIQEKIEAMAAGMMECSEAAQAYELAIAQVSTISDSSILSKDAMRSGILDMSTDLRRDAEEMAEAVYEGLSAGVDTGNVLGFTRQSTQLAAAGFTDVATSVDVLTTILNAYKMETDQAEKVASTLVKTQDLGKITVDELGKSVGRVIPSAAAYGVNLDNVATAYARMTASGINAENTTTYLSTMLDELADNGSDVAAVLLEQTGKSFAELMNSGNSLGDVLQIIGDSVDNDNTAFSNLWSSSTAGKAAISLFNTGAEAFNKTLDEMANSSGTVAKNYSQMTDVSEYASQRVAVASKNLSIAVGDQLNPVLDDLRNAGGAIMEVAANVVADNPILVSVISGTVAALGTLSASLAAVLIVKSVITAMETLNITLAANPIGLIALAVGGLVTALVAFYNHAAEANAQVDALTQSAQALNERTTEGINDYTAAVASAETAYVMCDGYIERLAELEAQGKLTDEQQAEYAMLIQEISSLIPELNIELDAQTGLLVGGTAALRDQVDAWKDAAIAEAAYTRYKDDIAAMVDAQYELALNNAKLSKTENTLESNRRRQSEILKEMTDNQEEANRIVSNSNMLSEETSQKCGVLLSEYEALQAELTSLKETEEAAQKEQAALTEAIGICEEAVASNSSAMEVSREALKSLEEEYPQLAGVVTESSESMSTSVEEQIKKINDAYAEMKTEADASLGKQINLFDDLSDKCELSTQEMIDNLRSQRDAFNNYATNIQLAMERGIDLGLVQQLSDGSAESMLILQELVTGTDDQIAELNAAFGGVSAAKDTAADAMAAVKLAYSNGLTELAGDVDTKSKTLGKQVVDGLIAGVEENKPRYKLSLSQLAEGGFSSYRERNLIKSPSRRYMWAAKQDVEGLIVQYKADTPRLKLSAAQMADAGYVAAIQKRRASIPSVSAAMPASPASPDTQTLGVLQQILAEVKAGGQIYLDSGVLVGSTAGQYDAAMGQRQFLANRGAT